MLPGAGLIIPLYVVLAKYHQVNVLSGVIIAYLTFVLPFSVWTLRGFILGIPKDLEEAAMVDGSTRLGAFMKILLPLVAPGLVATSVFAFITIWNEYIFARTLLNDAGEADAHGLALVFPRHEPEHRLGRVDGGVDADRDSRRRSSSCSSSGRSRSVSPPVRCAGRTGWEGRLIGIDHIADV